ncbi:MAG: carbohydrate ABC transporter substrate-binding protein [Butyrivibrio sp.]|uniref:ABC transporter substrate-binding protein n=1 Tax=Butyrivibrio sp. TaxID=28121 RepID=UPI001B209E5B|nr:ABC transporter substrate-binding protein [Butyrivibrio sp.]MBO6242384.1 carbohydrate ABC transporter substrate-binding protein [Butyrivibrio sp.]
MRKKVLSMLLATSMVAGIVMGCGQTQEAVNSADEAKTETADNSEDKQNVSESEQESVTLRFAWWGGDERNAATLEVIEQFEALHPGVTIEGEPGSSDGYHDKLATQLASGTAADIVQIDPETMPTFVDSGDYFVDLNTTSIDMSNFEANYIGLQINGNYDGKQLGLPTGIAGPAILVNKDVADKYGVDLTKTDIQWEDFIEMGKTVHEQDPEAYLFCINKEYITNLFVLTLEKQKAGKVYDSDGKLVITQDDLTSIFTYIKELYDNNVVAPASYQASYIGDDIQGDANWIAGKYVAAPCYISTVDVMVAANPSANYVAGSLPVAADAKDGGFASNTPQLLAITKSCSNPEIAAEFLDYFFNNEKALETLGATRSVPPTQKARDICAANGKLTQIVTDAADIAVAIGGTPNDKISSSEEAKTILYDAVEAIGYGQISPEQAAEEVYEQYKDLEK